MGEMNVLEAIAIVTVKLFVTASLAERAHRRWLELQARGVKADPATVEAEMLARDTRDAPNMRQAADAVVLDTTLLGADEAFEQGLLEVRKMLKIVTRPDN